MTESRPVLTLPVLIGRNVRRLRGSATLDEVAQAGRAVGERWTAGRVLKIERGQWSGSLATVLSLADVLGRLRGEPVRLAELVQAEPGDPVGWVRVAQAFEADGASVAGALAGEPVRLVSVLGGGSADEVAELLEGASGDPAAAELLGGLSGPLTPAVLAELGARLEAAGRVGRAEQRAAARLGVSAAVLCAASVHRWGQSLAQERDERAGPGASAQQRGRVTRLLEEQLRADLEQTRGHDGSGGLG